MGLFNKFKGGSKEETSKCGKAFALDRVRYADQVFVADQHNPALAALVDAHSYDTGLLSHFADRFIFYAKANTEVFSKATSLHQNDHLVHFFFDLYLALNAEIIHKNNEISSLSVDAMHIKYFGPPSHSRITHVFDLLLEPETCFLSSIFAVLSEREQSDQMHMFAAFIDLRV